MIETLAAVAVLRDWLLEHRSLAGAWCWLAVLDHPSPDPGLVYAAGQALGAPWALLEQAWAEIAWAAWRASGRRYYLQSLPHEMSAATLSPWRPL